MQSEVIYLFHVLERPLIFECENKKMIRVIANNENKAVEKVYSTTFHIAGFCYWEVREAFELLKIGIRHELVREDNNKFDP